MCKSSEIIPARERKRKTGRGNVTGVWNRPVWDCGVWAVKDYLWITTLRGGSVRVLVHSADRLQLPLPSLFSPSPVSPRSVSPPPHTHCSSGAETPRSVAGWLPVSLGDPQAEVTAVFAAPQTAVGPSPQCATSAGVTHRSYVTTTSVSTSITVNPGRTRDKGFTSSLVPLLLPLSLYMDLSFTLPFMTELPDNVRVSN